MSLGLTVDVKTNQLVEKDSSFPHTTFDWRYVTWVWRNGKVENQTQPRPFHRMS